MSSDTRPICSIDLSDVSEDHQGWSRMSTESGTRQVCPMVASGWQREISQLADQIGTITPWTLRQLSRLVDAYSPGAGLLGDHSGAEPYGNHGGW